MTITISPETESILREEAARRGQEADILADTLLAEALAFARREFEETVAGIERGLQAAAEGQERPFEDYVADVKRRRLERDREQKAEASERAACRAA